MEKINFEAGTIVTPAKVNEDKTITPAVWEGKTPLSPFMLNKLQENIENDQIEQNTVIDELKAKTIKCLQEVETPTPVSGTSIDLNDSAEAKITELKISGNSEQETRSGKNLLNFNGFATKEISGVTITNNNDGSITLNGTATANISIRLSNQMNKTLTAGNYYFSSNSKGSVSGAFTTFMFGNNDAEDIKFATITEENKGFSTSIDYKKYWLWLYINSGITFTNYIMKPQLEAGTVKTDWELYGASPSPDYPSENESCGDNINLFDKENTNILNDYYINSTANVGISSGSNQKILYMPVKKNTTYTASKILSSRFRLFTYTGDINGKIMTNFKISDNATSLSISTGDDTTLYLMYTANDTNEQEILNSIKIVEGTEIGGYSPYGQGCINEVICNKNLVVEIQKGYWTNTGVFDSDNNFCSSKQIKVEPGKTYVGSLFDKNKKYVGKLVYTVFDKNKNFIRYSGEDTITIANNEKYVSLRTYTSQLSYVTNNNLLMQLEEGSTATPYQECQPQTYTIPTQQPFRAIGDIRDTFILKNNKWYERHCIKRLILDGTENIVYSPTFNLFYTDIITDRKIDFINLVSNNFLNVYTSIDATAYTNMKNGTFTGSDTNRILFKATNYTTVDNFKAWLLEKYNAGTPVYVDYILETPLDIECTEEQSTILFDIEQNAKTYDKVTHMYSTDKISSYKDVTYKKDIETLFANTLVEGV